MSGASNQIPVLATITSPQTIQLGAELRFTLSATDGDTGDVLRFRAMGMPANTIFEADDAEFRFAPLADQVGTHTVTFSVSDGKQSSSQDVDFIVTPAAQSQVTALSSRVLDGNAFSEGRIVSLSGVTVSVEGSTVTATSDDQGYFTLSGIPHGKLIVSLDATGVTDSDGNTFANFKGKLPIMENVLNRPYREYLLPKIDATGMAMVDPSQASTVNNTNIGVSFTVPANTAMNHDGTAYTGPLSVSQVPTNATPRELPPLFRPNFIITLQPVGIRFANPLQVTFPNSNNLAPGSTTELYSLSEQGGFEQVGVGRVSSDGQRIELIAGGIRATTWHFFLDPTPEFQGMGTLDSGADGRNNTLADPCENIGSSVCPSSGILMDDHFLPAFKDSGAIIQHSLGYTNTPTLMKPTIIPRFKYQRQGFFDGMPIGISPGVPRSLNLRFVLNGSRTSRAYFRVSASQGTQLSDKPFLVGHNLDIEGIEPGMHEVESKLEVINGPTSNPSMRLRKDTVVMPILSPETEFGMGWRFRALHRLYGMSGMTLSDSQKIMLLYGNFKYLIYEKNTDGSYSSPKGDYSTLKNIGAPFGGFIRTTKEGVSFVFDSSGFLIGRTDRHGRRTSYIYADGKLSQITHNNRGITRFVYGVDGLIDTITDPQGRATHFEHDARKNLIRITDPDGNPRSFSYAQDHGLLSQTDKLGRSTNYLYDQRGNVTRTVRPDHSTMGVRSKSTDFLEQGVGSEDNPLPVILEGDRTSQITDSSGNATQVFQQMPLGQ